MAAAAAAVADDATAAADLVTCSKEMPRLINFLSSLLEKVAESNDLSRRIQPPKISIFHGLTRPTISIQSYLERIFKYANCSHVALLWLMSTWTALRSVSPPSP
ncbi:hypothetical protein QQ045_032251 [Rhodiola kirilowii]